MGIVVSCQFKGNGDEYIIINPEKIGYVEQMEETDILLHHFGSVTEAKDYITKVIQSIHSVGKDLSVIYTVLDWYETIITFLDECESNKFTSKLTKRLNYQKCLNINQSNCELECIDDEINDTIRITVTYIK